MALMIHNMEDRHHGMSVHDLRQQSKNTWCAKIVAGKCPLCGLLVWGGGGERGSVNRACSWSVVRHTPLETIFFFGGEFGPNLCTISPKGPLVRQLFSADVAESLVYPRTSCKKVSIVAPQSQFIRLWNNRNRLLTIQILMEISGLVQTISSDSLLFLPVSLSICICLDRYRLRQPSRLKSTHMDHSRWLSMVVDFRRRADAWEVPRACSRSQACSSLR